VHHGVFGRDSSSLLPTSLRRLSLAPFTRPYRSLSLVVRTTDNRQRTADNGQRTTDDRGDAAMQLPPAPIVCAYKEASSSHRCNCVSVCVCVCVCCMCVYVGYNPNKHIVLSATVCSSTPAAAPLVPLTSRPSPHSA